MTNPALNKQPNGAFCFVFRAVLVVGGLAGFSYGYDLTVLSGALLFLKQKFEMSDALAGFLTGALVLGGAFGALISGSIADKSGRRFANIFAMALLIIGVLITTFTPNITWMIIGRIILGIGAGSMTVVAPMYIAEIAPPATRGAMVTIFQLALTLGIMVSFIVDTSLAHSEAWRWMFGLNLIPAGLAFVLLFLIPQSPRWLISKNRDEKAATILSHTMTPENVTATVASIKEDMSHIERASWSELFSGKLFKVVLIGVILMCIQQISGVNTVFYYAPFIFEAAGFESSKAALIATTSVGIINFLMTLIAVATVDRWGRRPLFLLGLSLMIISLTVLGITFYLTQGLAAPATEIMQSSSGGGHTAATNLAHAAHAHQAATHTTSTTSPILGYITIACLMLFISSFALSLGPICFVTVSEIFPTKIRSKAIALALTANWLGNFFVAQTFLVFLDSIGVAMTFWMYAIINTAALIFVFFLVPETKGHTLEEIETRWIENGEKLR
ncbi:sugar porter family MFS transporter [Planctomycetota bacterium]|nr:sugar porter family MFS transporter [Planctomycetota bacterium]